MQNYVTFIFVFMLISGFAFVGLVSNVAMALPLDFLDRTYVFGPITGITEDENDNTDWVLAGIWRSSLSNSTETSSSNASAGTFNAAIDMMRPDGTARHTHTVTDFVLLNSSSPSGTNSTHFNGTSTVSLANGPALDIPTSIKLSNDNIVNIWMDPESVDRHFGESSTIFGIVASPEFDQSIKNSVSMNNKTQNSSLAY
jgi:hypothetical protein